VPEWSTVQAFPSGVGSWPYLKTFDQARKVCRDKRSSLFGLFMSDEEKQFCDIDTCTDGLVKFKIWPVLPDPEVFIWPLAKIKSC
jgi:hypothetical protein